MRLRRVSFVLNVLQSCWDLYANKNSISKIFVAIHHTLGHLPVGWRVKCTYTRHCHNYKKNKDITAGRRQHSLFVVPITHAWMVSLYVTFIYAERTLPINNTSLCYLSHLLKRPDNNIKDCFSSVTSLGRQFCFVFC